MTAQTADPRIAEALHKRIDQFYGHLNSGDFGWCFRAIDPAIRDKPDAIVLRQYALALGRFLNWCGGVNVLSIKTIQLHLDEPNQLYNDRDFAVVQIAWLDQADK